ncbi:MAG: PPOX class F420-dependent oxidoreductase [Mycobacteriales bacterium]
MAGHQRDLITMTPEAVKAFLRDARTATMATIGPTGTPHLVAMWFALLDGVMWFESKAKAQKVVNLRRDDRMTVLVEDGDTYDTLRGVSLEGHGVVVEDPEQVWAVGVDIWERYTGPYTPECKPFVEQMLHKRVVVRLDVERSRSWDHGKLGLPVMTRAGSTATR